MLISNTSPTAVRTKRALADGEKPLSMSYTLRIPPDKVLLRPGKFGKMSTTSTLMLPHQHQGAGGKTSSKVKFLRHVKEYSINN